MNDKQDRRREERLRYHWPIWFAEDFAGDLTQGQMADVSSGGAAFTYYSDGPSLHPGQRLTARFSVPRYGPGDSFDMVDFIRSPSRCRSAPASSLKKKPTWWPAIRKRVARLPTTEVIRRSCGILRLCAFVIPSASSGQALSEAKDLACEDERLPVWCPDASPSAQHDNHQQKQGGRLD
jgi:hypothetical protein